MKAIAMKCTEQQFESVKLKLNDIKISINDDFELNDYLTNNWNGGLEVANLGKYHPRIKDCKIYEEWNEDIFLESCGLKYSETITKSEAEKQLGKKIID